MTRRGLLALPAVSLAALAQQQREGTGTAVVIREGVQARVSHGPDENFNAEFISSEMGFEGNLVKGAPYSAETITETTQTLADGNRIARKNTSLLYRDSEGRTRRELSLGTLGPWAASGESRRLISINDPVAGVHYALDPGSKTARKMTLPKGAMAGAAFAVEALPAPPGGEGLHTIVEDVVVKARSRRGEKDPNTRTESLGKRMIEGVQAEGTRTTRTIAAGDVGNDRSIDIVSERWFSPDLQTVVMSRRSDPRSGETVYRLTGINRTEPPASLFEVPSDYTIKETSHLMFQRKIETR